jgi:hypothetical protein
MALLAGDPQLTTYLEIHQKTAHSCEPLSSTVECLRVVRCESLDTAKALVPSSSIGKARIVEDQGQV